MSKIVVPKTLGVRGVALWKSTLAEREFSAAEMALLEQFCNAFDVWDAAATQVKADGPTMMDRFGQIRPHPAVTIGRDACATMARLGGQLDLELADDVVVPIRHPDAARRGRRSA